MDAYATSEILYYCLDLINYLYKFCYFGFDAVLRHILLSLSYFCCYYKHIPFSNAFESF